MCLGCESREGHGYPSFPMAYANFVGQGLGASKGCRCDLLCSTASVCAIHMRFCLTMQHLHLSNPPSRFPLPQVQTSILYHRLHVSLDGIQLSTSNCTSSLSSRDTAVLSPCRCTAGLDLHRTSGDTLLPGTKACIQLDSVHVQLNPSSVAVINQSLLQLCSAPASDDLTEPPEAQHKVAHTKNCMCDYCIDMGLLLPMHGVYCVHQTPAACA